jgi:hypothetical protein
MPLSNGFNLVRLYFLQVGKNIFSSVSSLSFGTYPFRIFKVSHVLQYNNAVN